MATPISYLMTQVYISYLNITRYRYGNTSLLPQDTYIYILLDHHQIQAWQHLSLTWQHRLSLTWSSPGTGTATPVSAFKTSGPPHWWTRTARMAARRTRLIITIQPTSYELMIPTVTSTDSEEYKNSSVIECYRIWRHGRKQICIESEAHKYTNVCIYMYKTE